MKLPANDEMKPKIVHLLDGRSVSGAETLATLLMRQLTRTYRFSSICIGSPNSLLATLRDSGLPVHIVQRRPGLDWRCSRKLASILHREKADLVHAHQSSALLYAMLSRLLYVDPAILVTEHERPHPDLPSPKRASLNRLLFENRDQVVAASRAVRQALILNEGLPSDQVGVVYTGVAAPEARDVADVHAIRKDLGIRSDALLILQSAPFTLCENHILAIQAMEQVARELPEARLVLVGDGPELETIRTMVSRSGLESCVQFLGIRSDGAMLLRAADLVLSTSVGESVSPVMIQALAAGRPVVGTRVGAVAEVVEDRVCGLLACPGDYGTLAELIVRLGSSPGLREQFGANGRRRAARLFSEEETSQGYADIYQMMLSR